MSVHVIALRGVELDQESVNAYQRCFSVTNSVHMQRVENGIAAVLGSIVIGRLSTSRYKFAFKDRSIESIRDGSVSKPCIVVSMPHRIEKPVSVRTSRSSCVHVIAWSRQNQLTMGVFCR